MNKLKRLFAAVLACTALFAATACGQDTATALTINGTEIPAGVYIYYLSAAASEANSTYTTEVTDGSVDFWSYKIDDTDVKTWIENKAIESCKRYVANLSLADEYDAALTSDQKKQINTSVDSNWENYSETITKMGISKESYAKVYENTYIENNIFSAIYGIDGKTPVADAELQKYMTEILARTKFIQFSLKDKDQNAITAAAKEELIAKAKGYADRINAGESFEKIKDEYNETVSDITDPYENETWIWVEATSPSESFVKKVFEAPADGTATTFEDGDYYYLLQRLDASEREDYFDENRDSLLSEYKDDEFDEFIKKAYADYEVVRNEKAIKRYDAKKMNFLGE